MKIRLGDFFRALWPGSWFKHTKGISINLGDHEIHLNEGHGISKSGESKFDKMPSRPKPHLGPGR